MWPFREQKSWHQLGDDVPTVLNELTSRRQWERLPSALLQRFGDNASYVFDRSGEAASALRQLVALLELVSFQGWLRDLAGARHWRQPLLKLAGHLSRFAFESKQSSLSAVVHGDNGVSFGVADWAAIASLVCERYEMASYALLAQLAYGLQETTDEAALWCARYRRAEFDLLSEDESSLDDCDRYIREMLNPDRLRQQAREMRRTLPTDLIESLPGFNCDNPLTPNDVVEQIEGLVGLQAVP